MFVAIMILFLGEIYIFSWLNQHFSWVLTQSSRRAPSFYAFGVHRIMDFFEPVARTAPGPSAR